MRAVFLDVGAHKGSTLRQARHIPFDEIYAFEPSSHCYKALEAVAADVGAIVMPFGLLDRTCDLPLRWSGSAAASIYQDKITSTSYLDGAHITPELCHFEQASAWLKANILPDDEVFMKLNVEGAEVDILRDIWSNYPEHARLRIVLDWDSLKIRRLRRKRKQLLEDFPSQSRRLISSEWSKRASTIIQSWHREVRYLKRT